jgi:hypothetical protein
MYSTYEFANKHVCTIIRLDMPVASFEINMRARTHPFLEHEVHDSIRSHGTVAICDSAIEASEVLQRHGIAARLC